MPRANKEEGPDAASSNGDEALTSKSHGARILDGVSGFLAKREHRGKTPEGKPARGTARKDRKETIKENADRALKTQRAKRQRPQKEQYRK